MKNIQKIAHVTRSLHVKRLLGALLISQTRITAAKLPVFIALCVLTLVTNASRSQPLVNTKKCASVKRGESRTQTCETSKSS
jgi:hypothetical protein